jgi:phosphoheptose isomerase
MTRPIDDLLLETIGYALRDGARLRHATLERAGADIAAAARQVVEAYQRGNKVLLVGNGGSAADAQHIAAELVGRFVMERAPLPALALTVDSSILTSVANDYGYEHIFSRQVRALGVTGDLLIAITTSGRSPNVMRAIDAAREKGMHVVGLTGGSGKSMAAMCDVCVVVPSTETARIQEIHITVGHLLCEAVDAILHAPGPRTSLPAGKIVDLETLVALRERFRREGRTVVWTNGAFDVFHAGHLSSLSAARTHGDILLVGVNADASVRAAKGPTRPVFPVAERAALLAALEVVDYVLVFEEPTPVEVLSRVRPDVHCKGADYAPPNGAPIPEADLVRGYGGRIEFLPLVPDRSTTATVARLAK